MKSSDSFRRENSRPEKKGTWNGYDDKRLPELTEEQLSSFSPVTKKEHDRFSKGIIRPVGRPKKTASEKENPVAIRLSKSFLKRLKERARQAGYDAWQTYAKKVLRDDVEQHHKTTREQVR